MPRAFGGLVLGTDAHVNRLVFLLLLLITAFIPLLLSLVLLSFVLLLLVPLIVLPAFPRYYTVRLVLVLAIVLRIFGMRTEGTPDQLEQPSCPASA